MARSLPCEVPAWPLGIDMSVGDDYEDLGLSSDSDRPESLPGREEAELREYAKSLGLEVDIDADMIWVAQEAFSMPLPPSWAEYSDPEGRIYFVHKVTQESSWTHPMDTVFRELVHLIKTLRRLDPPESSVAEAVQAHLQAVHDKAVHALSGWSGPYSSDEGQYYYHAGHAVSLWENPVDEWRNEMAIRQQVLFRCLLHQHHVNEAQAGPSASSLGLQEAPSPIPSLPLNLARPSPEGAAAPPEPSSARSFATCISARSTCSVRSVTPRARGSASPRQATSPRQASPKQSGIPLRAALAAAASSSEVADGRSQKLAGEQSPESSSQGDRGVARNGKSPVRSAQAEQLGKAGEDDEEFEITFGNTTTLTLPKFGN
eukprot:TRINITY_DN8053_c0_g1_i4.p1 TRINITY_DN8053_c0_g1~~TRINITY_DN8053_c0_g1_i4.p1  ORF type:complete len:374 (+),score=73.96 TRINITY_DN8053_c0_g1_i4:129-1250(+)